MEAPSLRKLKASLVVESNMTVSGKILRLMLKQFRRKENKRTKLT